MRSSQNLASLRPEKSNSRPAVSPPTRANANNARHAFSAAPGSVGPLTDADEPAVVAYAVDCADTAPALGTTTYRMPPCS